MCSILWSMYPPPWPSCKLFILFTGYCLFKEPIRCKVSRVWIPSPGRRSSQLSQHFQNWFNIYKVTVIDENHIYMRASFQNQQNTNFHPQSIDPLLLLRSLVSWQHSPAVSGSRGLSLGLQAGIFKPIQSQAFPNSDMIENWNYLSWSLHLYHFSGLVSCELWHQWPEPLQSTFPELYFNIYKVICIYE